MDFFAVVETQRALRRFLPRPVADATVQRILEAATRAPSARGAEPWHFVVVRDPAVRQSIATHYRAAWEAGQERTRTLDGDRDVRTQPHYVRMMQAAAELAGNLAAAPVLIACCLDRSGLGPIVDASGRIVSPAAAYGSIFPAVQNLMLAARALGLGTTLTTLHAAFEGPLRTLLGLPDHFDTVAIIPLGYPRDRFGPTRRRPIGAVASLDRYGNPFPPRA